VRTVLVPVTALATSTMSDTIAGIRLPDSTIAREATEFVQDVSSQTSV
jgi:hypothetical protein